MLPVLTRDAPETADAVLRTLGRARWRLEAQRLADRLSVVALLLCGLMVAVAVVDLLLGQTFLRHYGVALLVGGLSGIPFFNSKRYTLADAARVLDRRAGTRERCATALALVATQSDHSPVEALAWADCAAAVRALPVRRWTPLTLPRAARWLPVPLITVGLLHWHDTLGRASAPTDPALQTTLRAQADELQKAADTAAGKKDDADRRLAEELQKAAERLRQAAAVATRNPDPEAARRDALRELSDLQNRLRRLAGNAGPSPAELAALATALQREGSEAARAAAEALRKTDGGEAARQLEKLLEELKKSADPAAALDQLARAMRDQAGKLSEGERGELARQMAQAQAEGRQREELLKKIADLLRQSGASSSGQPSANRGGQGGQGQPSGGQSGEGGGASSSRGMTNQQLQSLLNSLENMKNGLNGNGASQGGMSFTLEDDSGGGVSQAPKPGGQGGDGNTPTGGAPGSEHDTGTSEPGHRPAAGAPVPAERVARAPGLLGEGETLNDFAPSTDPAAPAHAGRRYREVYEAMAPAARDSVRQENIPLGSRVLVERYFQNIRPPD